MLSQSDNFAMEHVLVEVAVAEADLRDPQQQRSHHSVQLL
jgi:hypothetical protein